MSSAGVESSLIGGGVVGDIFRLGQSLALRVGIILFTSSVHSLKQEVDISSDDDMSPGKTR